MLFRCLGESGLTCSRSDQPQYAGAHFSHVRGCAAPDLHADAERLVPALHELLSVHRSTAEPGRAST